MPKSFTDAFHIDKKIFELCGALDIILDVDTKYFIDPALVRLCTCLLYTSDAADD